MTTASESGRADLGLRDVVAFNICAIVSFRWLAPAAKAGSGSLVLFLLAAIFFLIPSGLVIARLSQQFPEHGGLYAWTRHVFGPRHAFLCSWLYFMSNLFYLPSLVLFAVSTGAYTFGQRGAAMAEESAYAVPATLLLVWALFLANFLGLRTSKWVQRFGIVAIVLVVVLLVAMARATFLSGNVSSTIASGLQFNFDELNLFSVIAFAFVGLELAPILAGKIRDPERVIPKAALLAGVVSLSFYVIGTGSLLVLVRAGEISALAGLAQAGTAMHNGVLASGFAALVSLGVCAQFVTWVEGNTQLPYAIGVAQRLPSAFARLHPRWGTAYVSLLFQAAVATVILLMAQAGETVRTGYQIMLDMLVLATFIPFLYIFACGWRVGRRIAAASGLAITSLAIVVSAIPPAGVHSVVGFECKVIGGLALVVVAGLLLFHRYERHEQSALEMSQVES